MKEVEHLTLDEQNVQLEVRKKNAFLDSLNERYKDDFLPKGWSEEQKQAVLEITSKDETKKHLLTSIPMVCSTECKFRNDCPLAQKGVEPLGYSCAIEMAMIRHLMAEYIESLGVDTDNLVEMMQLKDLVNQDIQMLRASKTLRMEDFIQENVVGIDADGDPIMKKEIHLASVYEERLEKRRQKIFKDLVATRDARVKAGAALMEGATGVANLMQNFRTIKAEQEDAIRKQLGLDQRDEYIEAKEAEKKREEEKRANVVVIEDKEEDDDGIGAF